MPEAQACVEICLTTPSFINVLHCGARVPEKHRRDPALATKQILLQRADAQMHRQTHSEAAVDETAPAQPGLHRSF